MKPRPKWIVFDVGGVLFNNVKAFQKISDLTHIPTDQLYKRIRTFLGEAECGTVSFDEVMSGVLESKQSMLASALALWWEEDNWYEDALKLTEQLSMEGYHLAILTNNWRGMETALTHLQSMHVFDHVFESSVIGLRKPNPELFSYVEKQLRVTPREILLADNDETNTAAAKARGWQAFLYENQTSASRLRKLLLRGSDEPDKISLWLK